ncbi:MAG: nitrilase-related carbon-nitrogen hydrolase [Jatrophihabitantaceae bacterium]
MTTSSSDTTNPPAAGPAFRALALQIQTRAVNGLGRDDARAAMAEAIARIGRQAGAAVAWHGRDVRLVVLPEYVLSGFPMGDTVAGWADLVGLESDGPEYDALGAIAQSLGVYLAGNSYELDPNFADLYFQASWIIDPSGDVVLRYRRLHSLYSPSPYDVWDRYLELYGIDAVLPVARTELGALAAIASEEILYPELSRALALRGAEVIVHSTSEVSSPDLTPKAIARRARAIENTAYVVSCNSGGLAGIGIPADSTNGGSEILDFAGRPLARAGAGESVVACAELDLSVLRRERSRPGMGNLLSRTKTALWAQEYARHDVERPGGLLVDGARPERSYFGARQREVLDRLHAAGVLS